MLVRACRYFSNHPLVSNANASQPHGRGWFNVSDGGAAQEQKMLGAEGCMWGEHTNGDVLNLRMWPRATACVGPTLLSSLLCACPVEEGFSCSSGPVCAPPWTCRMGEALWSGGDGNVTEAYPRLLRQRCRMRQRGIEVAPLQPGFC